MTGIFEAATAEDYREFGVLIREYAAWLLRRLKDESWFMEGVLKHQSLDEELKNLALIYGPPKGKVLLANCDGAIAGGVAYRELSPGICEMKRMYLRDAFRGKGLGRKLCEAVIISAQTAGYRLMRLDTSRRLTGAITMYKTFGFHDCEPYRAYPEDLLPHLLFMELPLARGDHRIAETPG